MGSSRLLCSAAFLCMFAAGQSQTLIIPGNVDALNDASSLTSFPWNRDLPTASSNDIRIQYVYDSSNFGSITSPILISRLRFRAQETTASWTGGTYANVEVRLGEAGNGYDALDTVFANNWPGGIEPAPAYSGPVTVDPGTGNGLDVAGPWNVTVTLSTPVRYDPTSGVDFLLDVRHDGDTGGASSFAPLSDLQSVGSMSQRLFNSTDWTAPTGTLGFSDSGIVCEVGYERATGTFPSFETDKSVIGVGDTVQFTDTTFSSVGVSQWSWDLDGDGVADSSLQNPTFQYNSCGPVDVTLTVFDLNGQSFSITKTAAVEATPPVAGFSFTVIGTASPFTVQLVDESTSSPSSWDWDFDGDGITDSTAQNPSFQVPTRSIETVALTVSSTCGSDTLTQTVDTRLLVCTQFDGQAGWTSGSAFYLDANVTNPNGLTVEQLGVQIQDPGMFAAINVYIKPDTHVGSETNRGIWSLVATGINPNSAGAPSETLIDISDFSLAPGLWGIAIEYLLPNPTDRFNYLGGGATSASSSDVELSGGAVYSPAFGTASVFEPRNWNGCLYYAFGQTAGSFSIVGDGCAGSNGDTQTIGIDGMLPTIGMSFTVRTSNGPANQFSLINFGLRPANLDLTAIGAPGCVLSLSSLASAPTLVNANGDAFFPLPLPLEPSLVGAQFLVQPLAVDPAANAFGITLGNTGRATIGQ